MLRRPRSLVKVAVLWIRRAGYAVRGALPLAHGVSLLAPTPRYHRLGPAAALQPLCGSGKDAGSTAFDPPGRRFDSAALEQHDWVQARGPGQE